MTISIKELYEGKATIIKNKEYFSTIKYCKPFIDRMSEFTDKFVIDVKVPDQLTIDGEPIITYNRVLIKAILPSDKLGYNEAICFCYALDVRKPVAKFYRCYINSDTDTIAAFNPMWQTMQSIEPEEPINYADVKKLMELTDDFEVKFNELESRQFNLDEVDQNLGKWVRNSISTESYSEFGKVKLSPNNAIDAYKYLFIDASSDYYVEEGTSLNHSDIYEAFTQTIIDDEKDLMNKFDKTILVNKILEI